MKSLCFLVALMLVSVATVSESVEVAKRILPGLGIIGGDGGLIDGILGGQGGIIGGVLGGEGGILTNVIGGDKGILGGLLGLKASILTGLIKTVVGLVGGIVKSLVAVIGGLTKGLEGKTTEPEIYAEFRKIELKTLCPLCPNIQNPQHVALCQKYCQEQNWRP